MNCPVCNSELIESSVQNYCISKPSIHYRRYKASNSFSIDYNDIRFHYFDANKSLVFFLNSKWISIPIKIIINNPLPTIQKLLKNKLFL